MRIERAAIGALRKPWLQAATWASSSGKSCWVCALISRAKLGAAGAGRDRVRLRPGPAPRDAPSRRRSRAGPRRSGGSARRPGRSACRVRPRHTARRADRRRPDRPRRSSRRAPPRFGIGARGEPRPPWSSRRTARRSLRADSRRAERRPRIPRPGRRRSRWARRPRRRRSRRAGEPAGSAETSRARVSNASTIRASPVSTASGSPNCAWTEGLPRRVSASSKHGRSSWTSEAQWSSSIAAAAASVGGRMRVAARHGDREDKVAAGCDVRRERPRSASPRRAAAARRRLREIDRRVPSVRSMRSDVCMAAPAVLVKLSCHVCMST